MQGVEQIEDSPSVEIAVGTMVGIIDKEPLPISDIFVAINDSSIRAFCVEPVDDDVLCIIS